MEKYTLDLQKNKPGTNTAIFLCLVVYAGCFFFPLMDKDAAHHANIALRMYEHGDYINLIDRDQDYLDKPHLLFWVSAISFEIFGVNTFAHRFPALLFSLLSLFSTYRIAKFLSGQSTAWVALLLLATAQSFMLSIIDARMEAPLTAFIIFSTWQLIVYVDKKDVANLILAALGTALAFSTKGWLGPVIIFITVFFYMLVNKKWEILLRPKTWIFLILFFLFISPVLYAYYIQFDRHPEKIIRGQNHRSGVRFILWDQLFERAKGFDVRERNSSYFFLFHTFLWAFFPWSIMSYIALVYFMKRMIRRKWSYPLSFAALSFVFILFAISFSKFKMPHYMIMLLPLAALFTAPYARMALSTIRGGYLYQNLHLFFAGFIFLVTLALNFYFFPSPHFLNWIAGAVVILSFLFMLVKKQADKGSKIFWVTIYTSLLFNFFLNYNFFPNVMKYQAGNELVKAMETKNMKIPDEDIMLVELHAHSFDFYRKHNHHTIDAERFAAQYAVIKDKYFLVSPFLANFLRQKGFTLQTVISQIDYNVATIKFSFLNPATRKNTYDSLMLVKVMRP